jgi:PAS domain S-box-containing protein
MRNEPNPVTLDGIAIFINDEDEPKLSRIVYVNEAFVRMAGMSADQLVGHSAILLAGSRPKLHEVRAAMDAPKDRPYVTIHRKVRPDGTEYDAEVRIEPLPQSPGRPQHMVLTQRAL